MGVFGKVLAVPAAASVLLEGKVCGRGHALETGPGISGQCLMVRWGGKGREVQNVENVQRINNFPKS